LRERNIPQDLEPRELMRTTIEREVQELKRLRKHLDVVAKSNKYLLLSGQSKDSGRTVSQGTMGTVKERKKFLSHKIDYLIKNGLDAIKVLSGSQQPRDAPQQRRKKTQLASKSSKLTERINTKLLNRVEQFDRNENLDLRSFDVKTIVPITGMKAPKRAIVPVGDKSWKGKKAYLSSIQEDQELFNTVQDLGIADILDANRKFQKVKIETAEIKQLKSITQISNKVTVKPGQEAEFGDIIADDIKLGHLEKKMKRKRSFAKREIERKRTTSKLNRKKELRGSEGFELEDLVGLTIFDTPPVKEETKNDIPTVEWRKKDRAKMKSRKANEEARKKNPDHHYVKYDTQGFSSAEMKAISDAASDPSLEGTSRSARALARKAYRARIGYEKKKRIVVQTESGLVDTDDLVADILNVINPAGKKPALVSLVSPYICLLFQVYNSRSVLDVYVALCQFCNIYEFDVDSREMLNKFRNWAKKLFSTNAYSESLIIDEIPLPAIPVDTEVEDKSDFTPEEKQHVCSEFCMYKSFGCPAYQMDLIVETEGQVSDVLTKYKNITLQVISSSFIQSFREVALALCSLHLFEKDISKSIVTWLGGFDVRMTMAKAINVIVDAIILLIKVGESLASGVPISEVLTSGDPYLRIMSRINMLLPYSEMLYIGLPEPGKKNVREFVTEGTELCKQAEHILSTLPATSSQYSALYKVHFALQKAVLDQKSRLRAHKRMAPIGLVLVSEPGVGKSSLLPFLAALHSEVMGREYNHSHMYHRVTSSEYWEQYEPFSQPYIHYSEIGSDQPKRAAMMPDMVIGELTSLIDDLPMPVNMAFGEKNKVFAYPELVLIDTNIEDMNIGKIKQNEYAFRRRLIYIKPRVKPDVRLDQGAGIDPRKSLNSGARLMDKWTFDVYKFTASANDKGTRIDLCSNANIDSFCDVMRSEFVTQISSRTAFLKRETEQLDTKTYTQYPNVAELYSLVDYGVHSSMYSAVMHEMQRRVVVQESATCNAIGNFFLRCYVWFTMTWVWSWMLLIHDCCINFALHKVWVILWFPWVYWFSKLISTWFFKAWSSFCYYLLGSWWDAFIYMVLHTSLGHRIAVRRAKSERRAALAFKVRKLHELVIGTPQADLIHGQRWFAYGLHVAGALSGLALLYQIFNWLKENKLTVFNEGGEASKPQQEIGELESEVLATYGRKRFAIQREHAIWNTMSVPLEPRAAHTGTCEDLATTIAANTYSCTIMRKDGLTGTTHILGVRGNIALINTHALSPGTSITVSQNYLRPGFGPSTLINSENVVDIGGDLSLVVLNSMRFRDITSHLFKGSISRVSYTGNFRMKKVQARLRRNVTYTSTDGTFTLPDSFEYSFVDHRRGECGRPLILDINGPVIAGVHSGGYNGMGYATVINCDRILEALASLQNPQIFEVLSREDNESLDKFINENVDGSEVIVTSESATLIEPRPKSIVKYEDLTGLNYLGDTGRRILLDSSSKLMPTGFANEVRTIIEDAIRRQDIDPNVTIAEPVLYGRPRMRPGWVDGEYISPMNLAIKSMAKPKAVLDQSILDRCVSEFATRITNRLASEGIELAPLKLKSAINGCDDDPFTRRMNLSTSSGFGMPGKKRDHFFEEEKHKYVPSDQVISKVLTLAQRYMQGKSGYVVYTCKLKDEARTLAKCRAGKTRVFYMIPLDYLILSRMFLSPFYTLMVEWNETFFTSVGIDMHSQAHRVFDTLNKFGDPEHNFEGDYEGYDQRMPFQIGKAACDVIFRVLKFAGYNDKSLSIVNGILTDMMFPVINAYESLIEVPGLQPSGMYGTAENNSLRGVLLLMYAWYSNPYTRDYDFFENTSFSTYGDDVYGCVHPALQQYFNSRTYSEFCKEHYLMGFTAADKSPEVPIYTPLHKLTFLKRRIVWRKDISRWVAPLDYQSLIKTLSWVMPSDNVSLETQLQSMFTSVVWELAYHLPSSLHFETVAALKALFVEKYFGGVDFKTPSWAEIMISTFGEDYLSDSGRSLDEQTTCLSECDISYSRTLDTSIESAVSRTWLTNTDNNNIFSDPVGNLSEQQLIDFYSQQLVQVQMELDRDHSSFSNMRESEIRRLLLTTLSEQQRKAAEYRLRLLSHVHSLRHTINLLTSRQDRIFVQAESDIAESQQSTGLISHVATDENLMEVMGAPPQITSAGEATANRTGQQGTLDISNFLSRPIQIFEGEYKEGGNATLRLPIWQLFTSAPSIRAKLRNFAYLRADMNVRVIVSGTPFHSGRLLISYQPFDVRNDVLNHLSASATAVTGMKKLLNAYLSQSPGSATINVNENKPLEFKIPFINTKPMMRLFNTSTAVISAGTAFADAVEMGSLYVVDLNNIESVSPTPTPIYVQIFCWMTDVELGTSTATQLVVSTESGILVQCESDERETGPVEQIASRALQISTALESIPSIGIFAKASSIVFSGLRGLAALFGWSKPSIIVSPHLVRPDPFQNGAMVIGHDTTKRVVIDPKQELTVDPRVCGTDEDHMVIQHLTARNSLIDTFVWSPTNTVMANPIWMSRVNPLMCTTYTGNGITYVQPSAMAFAAAPFQYWRGDIIYRFEIVASTFHRGKIAVFYEPNLNPGAIINTDISFNKQFLRVVDIQDTQTFEVTVNWASYRDWLLVGLPTNVKNNHADLFNATERNGYSNGYIGVVPFTRLQSPDDSGVAINVYVRAEDMCFNYLTSYNMPTKRLLPGIVIESGIVVESESGIATTSTSDNGGYVSQDVSNVDLNPSTATRDHIAEHCFGEVPISFRALLKRYVTVRTFNITPGPYFGGPQFIQIFKKNIPSFDVADFGNSLEFPNLLGYLRKAYLGMRGSVKYRLHCNGINDFTGGSPGTNNLLSHVKISNINAYHGSSEAIAATGSHSIARNRLEGTVSFMPSVNGGIEYEIPYYSNNYFSFAFSESDGLSQTSDDVFNPVFPKTHIIEHEVLGTYETLYAFDFATGEDFSLLRFQGAPFYSF